MAEKLVLRAIGKYLDKFLLDFDSKRDFNIRLLKGSSEIRNVELNPDALVPFFKGLPIEVSRAHVGSIRIKYNLMRVKRDPIVVSIDAVDIFATEPAEIKPRAEQAQVRKRQTSNVESVGGESEESSTLDYSSDSDTNSSRASHKSFSGTKGTSGSIFKSSRKKAAKKRKKYPAGEKIVDGLRVEIGEIRVTVRTLGEKKATKDGLWSPPHVCFVLRNFVIFTTDEYGEARDLKKCRSFSKNLDHDIFVFKKATFSLGVEVIPFGPERRIIDFVKDLPVSVSFVIRKSTGLFTSSATPTDLKGIDVKIVAERVPIMLESSDVVQVYRFLLGLYHLLVREDIDLPRLEYGKSVDQSIVNIALAVDEASITLYKEDPQDISKNDTRQSSSGPHMSEGVVLSVRHFRFNTIKTARDYEQVVQGYVKYLEIMELSSLRTILVASLDERTHEQRKEAPRRHSRRFSVDLSGEVSRKSHVADVVTRRNSWGISLFPETMHPLEPESVLLLPDLPEHPTLSTNVPATIPEEAPPRRLTLERSKSARSMLHRAEVAAEDLQAAALFRIIDRNPFFSDFRPPAEQLEFDLDLWISPLRVLIDRVILHNLFVFLSSIPLESTVEPDPALLAHIIPRPQSRPPMMMRKRFDMRFRVCELSVTMLAYVEGNNQDVSLRLPKVSIEVSGDGIGRMKEHRDNVNFVIASVRLAPMVVASRVIGRQPPVRDVCTVSGMHFRGEADIRQRRDFLQDESGAVRVLARDTVITLPSGQIITHEHDIPSFIANADTSFALSSIEASLTHVDLLALARVLLTEFRGVSSALEITLHPQSGSPVAGKFRLDARVGQVHAELLDNDASLLDVSVEGSSALFTLGERWSLSCGVDVIEALSYGEVVCGSRRNDGERCFFLDVGTQEAKGRISGLRVALRIPLLLELVRFAKDNVNETPRSTSIISSLPPVIDLGAEDCECSMSGAGDESLSWSFRSLKLSRSKHEASAHRDAVQLSFHDIFMVTLENAGEDADRRDVAIPPFGIEVLVTYSRVPPLNPEVFFNLDRVSLGLRSAQVMSIFSVMSSILRSSSRENDSSDASAVMLPRWESRDPAMNERILLEAKKIRKNARVALNAITDARSAPFSKKVEALNVMDLRELEALMRDEDTGVPLRDRRSLAMLHKSTFVASEAITWLVCSLALPARSHGLYLLRRIVKEGIAESVTGGRQVDDGNGYLRFTNPELRFEKRTGWQERIVRDLQSAEEGLQSTVSSAGRLEDELLGESASSQHRISVRIDEASDVVTDTDSVSEVMMDDVDGSLPSRLRRESAMSAPPEITPRNLMAPRTPLHEDSAGSGSSIDSNESKDLLARRRNSPRSRSVSSTLGAMWSVLRTRSRSSRSSINSDTPIRSQLSSVRESNDSTT